MSLITLVIDDDKLVCMLHEKVLKYSGIIMEPLCFHSALEALGFLQQNYTTENDYLVFLDINMPEMNGWEFLDAIKAEFTGSNFYVFLVSSSLLNEDQEKAESYDNVVKFVEKPLTFSRLKEISDMFPAGRVILPERPPH